jgi:broad specificity phosphatase PhoE
LALIYMVRHGQTVWNVDKRFRGTIDVPLNERGRTDAHRVAEHLAAVGLAAVYTSPLSRAREVADAIAGAAGLPGTSDLDGLLNLDYGDWHGLTKDECATRDPDAWRRYRECPEQARCPGGEALANAAERVTSALIDLSQRHAGGVVAAVSHGVMVRLAALRAGYASGGDWEIPLDTGSATAFQVTDGALSVVTHADRRELPRGAGHLRSMTATVAASPTP